MSGSLRVKVATEDWEYDEIHRLNHHTFTAEIPQHPPQPSGVLKDRFHEENKYIIALRGSHLMGMVVLRDRRPFSLDQKLRDLDSYLPPGLKVCELRLLAVAKPHRSGRVLRALVAHLWHVASSQGFEAAVISATTTQLQLYRRLGFLPFGPLVGSTEAPFQPMILTRERAAPLMLALEQRNRLQQPRMVNLVPGPVAVEARTRRAFARRPESHRGRGFASDLTATRQVLRQLTGARHAEILVGTGTLANDAIAAQLSLQGGSGLILSNGEFGERLVDHAQRFRLEHDVMRWPWGEPIDWSAVAARLGADSRPAWVWCTQVETSTGVLNDIDSARAACSRAGARLCLDAVSSLGTLPIDLTGVWFASGASGKGLRSLPGLALVFYNHEIRPVARLPRYLDLGLYACADGVPFTHSSNLVAALRTAIEGVNWDERHQQFAETSTWLNARLRERGFDVVAATRDAAPGIVTIALPAGIDSRAVALLMEEEGYALAAHSGYLVQRNWLQMSLMSLPCRSELDGAIEALQRACADQ